MNLAQVNKMWISYKKKMQLDSEILFEGLLFDAQPDVEASVDLMEMLEGHFILHVTRKIHLYRGDYIHFLLMHEFTHVADFLNYPFPRPDIQTLKEREERENNINTASRREILSKYGQITFPKSTGRIADDDIGKKLFDYMNTYSEFHSCRVALGDLIGDLNGGTVIDADKNQIPRPYRDISIRAMLSDVLRHAYAAYSRFKVMLLPQVFVIYFRQVLYLFGYVSFFGNAKDMLGQSFKVLGVSDKKEDYFAVYDALIDQRYDDILFYTNKIYSDAYVSFVKSYVREHYDPELYTEEELDRITPENYHDFIELITNRKGGRLWSGRVSPVFGVNDVNKAYRAVDPEEIRRRMGMK